MGNVILSLQQQVNQLNDLQAEFNRGDMLAQAEAVEIATRAPNAPYTGVPHASNAYDLNERRRVLARQILVANAANPELSDEMRERVQAIYALAQAYFEANC